MSKSKIETCELEEFPKKTEDFSNTKKFFYELLENLKNNNFRRYEIISKDIFNPCSVLQNEKETLEEIRELLKGRELLFKSCNMHLMNFSCRGFDWIDIENTKIVFQYCKFIDWDFSKRYKTFKYFNNHTKFRNEDKYYYYISCVFYQEAGFLYGGMWVGDKEEEIPNIPFNDCKFNHGVKINSISTEYLNFSHRKYWEFSRSGFPNSVSSDYIEKFRIVLSEIKDVEIYDQRFIELKITSSSSEFINLQNIIADKIYIETKIKNLKITSSKYSVIDSLRIIYSEIENLLIDTHIINYLEITELKKEINLKIFNLISNKLYIHNTIFLESSKFILNNLKLKEFIFSNITQEWSEAVFENITVTEKFILEKVDFQKAKFVNCDFSECEIKISDSVSFKDTLFKSVKWGNISRVTASRDTFRELKFINDSQGNIIEANNFYSEEMRRYKKEIEAKPENFSVQDKVTFWLNEKISNFGQNWFRPILWFLILATFQYLINLGYENNTLYKIHEPWNIYIEKFSDFLNNLAKNILPLKKFLNKGFEFLSLFFYGIYITLIYHLTIALRRQTKR
jgi:uncharacterized protein YjbI with pentapeptide repeats